VFLDYPAWVGSSAGNGDADGTPASVRADGKELTVYIYVECQPGSPPGVDLGGRRIIKKKTILNVEFQRNGN